MSKALEIPNIDILSLRTSQSQKSQRANRADSILPQTVHTNSTRVSARSQLTPRTMEHPRFLYLIPCLQAFDTFQRVFHEYCDIVMIFTINPTQLNEYKHFEKSFNVVMQLSQEYFNNIYSAKHTKKNMGTSPLYRTGVEMLEDWKRLIQASNDVFNEGFTPHFVKIWLGFNELQKEVNFCFKAMDTSLSVDRISRSIQKSLTQDIKNMKETALSVTRRCVHPGTEDFDVDGFCKASVGLAHYCVNVLFGDKNKPVLMNSGEIMRMRTSLEVQTREIINLANAIKNFEKESFRIRDEFINLNSVMCILLKHLGFPETLFIKVS